MSASGIVPSPAASLPSLLASLRIHLSPAPLLNALPTSLQLFAHFQLVSERIKAEAARALAEHHRLFRVLQSQGIRERETLAMGVLNEVEGRRLKRLIERDEEDTMFAFSLEFRKHHLAIVLSTLRVPPDKARSLIDHYFPHILTPESSAKDHKMLYIRCMRSDQLPTLQAYREKVLGWYGIAIASYRKGNRHPSLEDLIGRSRHDMLDVLSRNMLKEAERIIRHFKELEAMFPPIADSEEEGSTAEAMRDILPDVYVSPRLEKSSLAGPSPKSRKDLTREHPFAGSSHVIDRSEPPARTRQPKSEPSTASPETSPEKIARIPRVSFDMSKGRARPRISINRLSLERQSSVHTPTTVSPHTNDKHSTLVRPDQANTTPLRIRHAPQAIFDRDDLKDAHQAPSNVDDLPAKLSHLTPTDHDLTSPLSSPARQRPALPNSTSPRSRKRPRTSSGFPPRSGPDFTAASPSFGANVERSRFRPFENSKLKRASDENSPEAQKRRRVDRREGLAEGASQENSQESVAGSGTGSKDKVKTRQISTPQDVFA